jgi:signal peptidase I
MIQFIRSPYLISVGYQLPFFLALCYLLTNDDISPYVVQGSIGPSMLPTIQFIGDLWLVETWAWYCWMQSANQSGQ